MAIVRFYCAVLPITHFRNNRANVRYASSKYEKNSVNVYKLQNNFMWKQAEHCFFFVFDEIVSPPVYPNSQSSTTATGVSVYQPNEIGLAVLNKLKLLVFRSRANP